MYILLSGLLYARIIPDNKDYNTVLSHKQYKLNIIELTGVEL